THTVSKGSMKVMTTSELPQLVMESFLLAKTGRPGPVILEIPEDFLKENINTNFPSKAMKINQPPLNEFQLDLAVEEIKSAKSLVVLVGGGVILSSASNELRELVKKLNAPAVSTLMGLGTIPIENPLFLGMLGMHGTFAANKAVHRADV